MTLHKARVKIRIALLSCIILITIASGIIVQMNKNHLANERIIEKCYKDFEEYTKVSVVKTSFWSSVTCEKQQ